LDTNNRMKEIARNLHRDVKELLQESANIVTGFFMNGLCTVRNAADHWNNFTKNISDTLVSLFKSGDPPVFDIAPDQEPYVRVMESEDPALPAGTCLRLSEMEDRIAELNRSYWDTDEPERPARLAIDYRMDGEVDRYVLPISTGPGCGSMLEQMAYQMDAYQRNPSSVKDPFNDAPFELAGLLRENFGPQLRDDLKKLSTRVLGFFQQHYTISQLEQQFDRQAMVLPEKKKETFLQGMRESIRKLREATNTGQGLDPAPERTAPTREETPPRKSVKVKLNKIKQEQAKGPVHVKVRSEPER